jgi:hypothetical protein
MRLSIALLLLLCAIAGLAHPAQSPAVQNPQPTQRNSAQAQVRKAPENKDISKQSQPAVSTESNKVSANYYEDQDKDKGRAKPVSDWLLAIFTLALVVVGLLQWLVLRKHETWMQKNVEMVKKIATAAEANTKAIESQATIMNGQIAVIEDQNRTLEESVAVSRDAAKSASLNAKAIINAERPWIVIEIHPGKVDMEQFLFTATNKGRTPAEFISGDAAYIFILDPMKPPPLNRGSFNRPNDTLVIRDAGFEIYPDGVRPRRMVVDARNRRGEGDEPLILILYGGIVYRNIIDGTEHETRWYCAYNFQENRFITTGPDGYNKHT